MPVVNVSEKNVRCAWVRALWDVQGKSELRSVSSPDQCGSGEIAAIQSNVLSVPHSNLKKLSNTLLLLSHLL